MRIVHLAAEFAPLIKAGGLGDVLAGLNSALTDLGHQSETILPKYDLIDLDQLDPLEMDLPKFRYFEYENTMYRTKFQNSSIKLLDAKMYFQRKKLYGCEDDTKRFLYFAGACIEYLKLKNEPIDILHLHDWHVAIAAYLVKSLPSLPIRKIVFTIHNGLYQGICLERDLRVIGLQKEACSSFRSHASYGSETFNLMKAGITHADATTTVSPSYAKELLNPDEKSDLSITLQQHRNQFFGILNGIDQTVWNPETDPALPIGYHANASISSAKNAAKETIRSRFKKPLQGKPWMGAITRLVPQKGPEFLIEAIQLTQKCGGVFVLLGSSPLPELQQQFETLQRSYKEDPNILFYFQYDETLAHQLYAALDFFLIPSLFEPCGLTQMIALRYGTIPIVRETGGLKDTMTDLSQKNGNGFTFKKPSIDALNATLRRAFSWFHEHPKEFERQRQKAMRENFGWQRSAQAYITLYKQILEPPHG